jgi:hypothetical protein
MTLVIWIGLEAGILEETNYGSMTYVLSLWLHSLLQGRLYADGL